MKLLAAILLLSSISMVTAYNDKNLSPGSYCGKGAELGGGCCKYRNDNCTHNYVKDDDVETKCYCDEICMKNDQDDCCPDYKMICLGQADSPIVTQPTVTPPITEPSPIIENCELGTTKKIQCNKCICKEINGTIGWSCKQDECLFNIDIVQGLVTDQETWRGTDYPKYNNKKLVKMLKYRLGTFPLYASATRLVKRKIYNKDIEYPQLFSAVNKWPSFISPIQDQGWCGSDWAMSTASVMSDRFGIQSKGAEVVVLSAQNLLSCNRKKQHGCDGGRIGPAWNYVRKCGLVQNWCMSYKSMRTRCTLQRNADLLESRCSPANHNRTSLYKSRRTYRLVGEKDIMYEIMNYGPVQAVMTVYQDFFHYQRGVYRHTRHGDQVMKGLHSVKIVGWGVTSAGVSYWIVANSWGEAWGEHGYFRIARGTNESDIESFVVAAMSEVIQVN